LNTTDIVSFYDYNGINNIDSYSYSTQSGTYFGISDCYDSSLGGQVCSDLGIVYSITDDPSDKIFKTNVKNLTLNISKINSLVPSEWDWNMTTKTGKGYGLVADDLLTIYPELVKTGQQRIFNGTINQSKIVNNKSVIVQVPIWINQTYKTIDYAGIIGLQLAKIQSLQKQIIDIKNCANQIDYKSYQTCISKV
jgi:hypothetical protein